MPYTGRHKCKHRLADLGWLNTVKNIMNPWTMSSCSWPTWDGLARVDRKLTWNEIIRDYDETLGFFLYDISKYLYVDDGILNFSSFHRLVRQGYIYICFKGNNCVCPISSICFHWTCTCQTIPIMWVARCTTDRIFVGASKWGSDWING